MKWSIVKSFPLPILIICVLIQTCFSIFAQVNQSDNLITRINDEIYYLNDIKIDLSEKSIIIPAFVNMNSGLIEVVLCRPEGKTHESLLKTNVTPLEFQTALLLLGLDPVNELPDSLVVADPLSPYLSIETPGDSVWVFLEAEINNQLIRNSVEHFILDQRTMKPLPQRTWLFRGAVTHRSGHVIIDSDVTMIATYHDPIALMELNDADKYDDELFYVNEMAGLEVGQKVSLIIQSTNK